MNKYSSLKQQVVGFFIIMKSGVSSFFLSIARFSRGILDVIQYFAKSNFDRIIKALFLFLSLILINVNPYIAFLFGCMYLIYEVKIHVGREINKLMDPEFQKIQNTKRDRLKAIPGFFKRSPHLLDIDRNHRILEEFEILTREVYDWFREDKNNPVSMAFIGRLKSFGYSDNTISEIANPRDSGIHTLIAQNTDHLLVLTSGTDFFSFNQTLLEDLDDSCPGRQAFLKHRNHIVRPILGAAKNDKIQYINLAGHSFGGAISMMIAVELMKEIKSNELDVKGINIPIFQSAGVNEEVSAEAKQLLEELQTSHPDFKVNMIAHFHDYDPIPASGEQILADYKGSNAEVFAIRRHLTFRSFLLLISTPFGFLDAHTGYVYNHKGYHSKHDIKVKAFQKNSVIEIYHYDKSDDEKKSGTSRDCCYIKDQFLAKYTKFVCNETLYQFLNKHKPLVWKTFIMGIALLVCVAFSAINLFYVLFMPGLLQTYNFYASLAAPLLLGHCFSESYEELFAGEVTVKSVQLEDKEEYQYSGGKLFTNLSQQFDEAFVNT